MKLTYVPTRDEYRRLLQEVSAAPCRAYGWQILNSASGWKLTDIEADTLIDAYRELPTE